MSAGGGVYSVLSRAHERHRRYAMQHELHQQQPGHVHRPAVHTQPGRRHQGQKGQV